MPDVELNDTGWCGGSTGAAAPKLSARSCKAQAQWRLARSQGTLTLAVARGGGRQAHGAGALLLKLPHLALHARAARLHRRRQRLRPGRRSARSQAPGTAPLCRSRIRLNNAHRHTGSVSTPLPTRTRLQVFLGGGLVRRVRVEDAHLVRRRQLGGGRGGRGLRAPPGATGRGMLHLIPVAWRRWKARCGAAELRAGARGGAAGGAPQLRC